MGKEEGRAWTVGVVSDIAGDVGLLSLALVLDRAVFME